MDQNLETLYQSLVAVYRKDTDQDFPTNKIRFFMDFLWNSMLAKPLTEEQKTSLKNLIDLLNSLDDHKLSPTRDLITNMSGQLTPLLEVYPSLGHTFTFVVTTLIPAYQRYLTSLEGLVKDAHPFTRDEIFLYYDMTLVDHAILSHVFESEQSLNLVEVITSIKTVIVTNAITHDYLQDSLGRSISLFTFLQRGGLAKEKCHEFYIALIDSLLENLKASVTNQAAITAVEFLCRKLVELTLTAQSTQPAATQAVVPTAVPIPESVATAPGNATPASDPLAALTAAPAVPVQNEVEELNTLLEQKGPEVVEEIVEHSHDPIDQNVPSVPLTPPAPVAPAMPATPVIEPVAVSQVVPQTAPPLMETPTISAPPTPVPVAPVDMSLPPAVAPVVAEPVPLTAPIPTQPLVAAEPVAPTPIVESPVVTAVPPVQNG